VVVVVAVESIKLAYASAEEGWRNPITGIAGCCARGASDHAAALDANRKQLEAHKREHEQGSPRSRGLKRRSLRNGMRPRFGCVKAGGKCGPAASVMRSSAIPKRIPRLLLQES
jgi:hypothetical protein